MKLSKGTGFYWSVLCQAKRRFGEIDGEQRAAAFAYYAMFSVFPLIVLFVTVGSFFVKREAATQEIMGLITQYTPLGKEKQDFLVKTIHGVIQGRGKVGFIALLVLIWSSLKFLKVLIRATNRAWQSKVYNWWQLPVKSLALLGIVSSAVLFGVFAPTAVRLTEHYTPAVFAPMAVVVELLVEFIPMAILFYGLSMFYKLAPSRPTRFSEVWLGALAATITFRLAEMLFVWYARNFAHWNALYGALGGVIGFLMWVYVSGWLFVMGACFCSSQAELSQK